MEDPFRPVFLALARAWLKENKKRSPDELPPAFHDFVPWRLEETLGSLVVQHVDEIEVDGRPWVLVFADEKVHLAHVTADDLDLETLFIGPLPSGDYREVRGDLVRLEFSHPRLESLKVTLPLRFEGASAQDEPIKTLRPILRRWAEENRPR
jgi:hypothetical protein